MQSLYIRNIDSNIILNKKKYKYYYIPSLVNGNHQSLKNSIQLPKIIFNNSKLFYGNNKILIL